MTCPKLSTIAVIFAAALPAAELRFNVPTSTGVTDKQFVATDAAGNTYVAGTSSSTTATFLHGTRGGPSDVRVMKIDPNGQIVWSAMVGGLDTDVAQGIALDPAGNIFVAAGTMHTMGWPLAPTNSGFFSSAPQRPMVVSLTNNGATVRYSSLHPNTPNLPTVRPVGLGLGIQTDADSNAYLVLSLAPATTTLVKLSATGAVSFVRSFDLFGQTPTSFAAGPSGFLAYFSSSTGGSDGFLRSDGLGNIALQILLPFHLTQPALALDPSANGNFYLAGIQADGSFRLQKRDLNATVLRDTSFGLGVSNLGGVSVNNRGEIWLLGQTTSLSFPLVNPFASSSGRLQQSFVAMFDAAFVAQISSYVDVARPTWVAADNAGASFAINGSHAGRIVQNIADAGVSVVCGPRSGSTSTCTGTVQNLGPDEARQIRLIVVVPFIGSGGFQATTSQGTCSQSLTPQMRIFNCLLGNLASGASATVSITPASISAGVVSRWAITSSESRDPNSANNSTNAAFN